MSVSTIVTLAEHRNVVAVKESSGSLDQASNLVRAGRPTVLSGDDNLTLPLLAVGARGVVSVAGNVFPRAVVSMTRAGMEGDVARARAYHLALMPLFKGLFIESNPLPAKHAVASMGLIREELRLPLVPMRRENAATLDGIVESVRGELERIERGTP
jgi:4-hydroxy-tetrahydrodipicolinate synthase